MTQISPHFSLDEVQHTDHDIPNEIPQELAANAIRLAEDVLEPLRVFLGPLKINSWYRSPAVNEAVGGEKNSYHLLGLATDVVPSGDVFSAFKAIQIHLHDLPIDKVIFEERNSRWIHIQTNKDGEAPRHLAFTAHPEGGRMVYKPYVS